MKSTRATRLVELILRRRVVLALVLLALLGFLAFGLRGLSVDNSLEVWFVEDDPALTSYRSFQEEFGNDEVVVTAISEAASVYDSQRLADLARLTDELRAIEGVSRVLTLANLPGAPSGASPGQLRELVASSKSARRLVGADERTYLVYSWLEAAPDIDARRGEILSRIEDAASGASRAEGDSVGHAGFGVVYEALNQATVGEGSLFILLSYVVVLVATWLATRRIVWVAVALFSITGANLVVFGLMGALGRPVNMVTMALPPLVMVLGVANIMHVAKHLEHRANRASPGITTLAGLLAAVLVPCFVNALTTAGGFLSLGTAGMAVTRDYGLFAAIGVVAALIFSSVGASLVARRVALRPKRPRRGARLGEVVERVVGFALRRKKLVVVSAALLTAVAALGIWRVDVDTYSIDFLPDDHPVRADSAAIEEQTGNYLPLEFVVSPAEGTDVHDPGFAALLSRTQTELEKDSQIGVTYSVADIDPGLWPALEVSGAADHLIADDRGSVRLTATAPMATARTLRDISERAVDKARETLGDRATIEPSGYLPLYDRIVSSVLDDQIKSFAIAFAVIFILIGAVLRSWRLVLVAIPANLAPIAVMGGVMGWAGIRLDVATVTVAAAVLGIIVDDTVHILYGLKRALARGVSVERALAVVARRTGAAVVATSFVLCAGFGLVSLSTVKSVGYTGLLTMVAVAAAMLADLVLLPVVASLVLKQRGKPEQLSMAA